MLPVTFTATKKLSKWSDMIKKEDLPKITKQEKAFVEQLALGKTQIDAYKSSYNAENMNDNSVRVEACRVAKRSDVQIWLEYFKQNIQKSIETKINYTALNAFEEYEETRQLAKKRVSTDGATAIRAMQSAIDGKVRISGVAPDKDNELILNNNLAVQIPAVKIDGKDFTFEIGNNNE